MQSHTYVVTTQLDEIQVGGSGNTAAFQVHAWRWAVITFSVTASLEGGSEWIGGADPTVYPHFAAQNLYLISDIFPTILLL